MGSNGATVPSGGLASPQLPGANQGAGRSGRDRAVAVLAAVLVVALAGCHEGEFGPKTTAMGGAGGVSNAGGAGGPIGGGAGGTAGAGGVGGAGGAAEPRDAVLVLKMDERSGSILDRPVDITCAPGGSPSYGLPGLKGNAIGFAAEERFDCGAVERLTDLSALTIAAWVRAAEVPSTNEYGQAYIVAQSEDDVHDGGFALRQAGSGVLVVMDAEEPYGRQFVYSQGALTADAWVHVAAVYDGASLQIYLDGQLDAAVGAAGSVPGGNASLVVGNTGRASCGDPPYHPCELGFRGRLDEVRLYDRALSTAEVAELAASRGWVAFVADTSGVPEIWAVRDDGSRSVRLTDGILGGLSGRRLMHPTIAWDGAHIGALVQQNPGGGADSQHVYVMKVDGRGLAARVDSGRDPHGFSWDGDSRTLVYSNHEDCSEDLYRIEALGAAPPTLLYDGQPTPQWPDVSPLDPNEVVFFGMACNSSPWFTQRLAISAGTATPIASVPPNTPEVRWSYAGDKLVYGTGSATGPGELYVLEAGATSSALVLSDPLAAGFGAARWGSGGTRIYAVRADLATGQQDLVAVAVGTGAQTTLATALPTTGLHFGLSWGIFPYEVDRDGDGLANGIDPSPDG